MPATYPSRPSPPRPAQVNGALGDVPNPLGRARDRRRQRHENRAFAEAERQLRLAGLKAEREEIFAQARSRRIDDQMARKLVRELDLVEARLAQD